MKIKIVFVTLIVSVMAAMRADSQTAIDGLFGIKLGEPLPSTCTNSQSSFENPDEWGFQEVTGIIPPQPNSQFTSDSYSVRLTPTNHLVCVIRGKNKSDPAFANFETLRDILRQKYGDEDESKSVHLSDFNPNYEALKWLINGRSLWLAHYSSGSTNECSLICADESLAWHPAHGADTNGL